MTTQALINNPVFVQLLPLLSPVLPMQLEENEHTRGLDHQARKEATRRVMLLVLSAKLAHIPTTLVLENVREMGPRCTYIRICGLALVRKLCAGDCERVHPSGPCAS